ncbi:T9SS type A sorting domain-containing protein [Polaribacter sp. SA4-12]|uniref:T9SS type A sorting domain-containing protein n=1 Tax=Polaribacter sp. SA4-12 TaxID=1312072 RepID=UPI000B3C5115|nr:T9SS type A sorting domain-containing protein [Polaribacter sp. SA4-12]ARV14447.1 hypothetical protein BTO07_04475 [Polaribacter sp. SA4-12]
MRKNISKIFEFWGIQYLKNNFTHITVLSITLLLAFCNETYSQSIPPTSSTSEICGDCNPTNWQDADIAEDGTPDVSNKEKAGGNFLPPLTGGSVGYNATWNISGATGDLPSPPTAINVRWITIRDIGDVSGSGQFEENVATTITDLVIGKLYKIKLYTLTARSMEDGGSGTNEYYSGTYLDQFAYTVEGQPRRDVFNITQDVWGQTTIVFIATATSHKFTLFPGVGAGGGDNLATPVEAESLHVAVGTVDAIVLLDSDGDGIDDGTDIDDDNDGILDTLENIGGINPNADADADGIPNYLDVDNNGGGTLGDLNGDGVQDYFDFDGDGIANHLDIDSDNDGIIDNIEAQPSTTRILPTGSVGANGLYDVYESNTEGGVYTISPINTDLITLPDYLDIDADNDGIPDNVEFQTTAGYIAPSGIVGENGLDNLYENNDSYSPATNLPVNTDSALNNSDTIPDYRDSDSDGDETPDIEENNRSTDGITSNNVQPDALSGFDDDNDGLDNNFDNDVNTPSNWDVNDEIEVLPTNLFNSDPLEDAEVDYRDDVTGKDTDGDGIPDIVDIDDDNDGILDTTECPLINTVIPTGTASGIADYSSVGNPQNAINGNNNQRASLNSVNDYLIVDLGYIIPNNIVISIRAKSNNSPNHEMSVEQSLDGVTFSNLQNDTFGNNTEVAKTYTLVGTSRFIRIKLSVDDGAGSLQIDNVTYAAFTLVDCQDTDSDGIPDSLDIDSDNDGIIDNREAQDNTYVLPTGSVGANGLYDIYENGTDGGTYNFPLENTDLDIIPDYLDLDSDDDGIPDNVEAQTTSGYEAPNLVPGVNGLDSRYDFTDNYNSAGLTPVNTDGVDNPDYRDDNSDGDLKPDIEENGDTDNTLSGNDLNNNGIDDNFDAFGNLAFDVNDDKDTPSIHLPDTDADVNSGGDVDYRDDFDGIDTDGDGIADSTDIDDDNDGILDIDECGSVVFPIGNATAAPISNDVSNPTNALLEITGNAVLNNNNDFLIIDLGRTIVMGTIITIRSSVGNTINTMEVQSSIGTSGFANNASFSYITINAYINQQYTLVADARYIRISMIRDNSNLRIDGITYDSYTDPCGLDTDGDGIINSLDLDSDNDGILDNIEAQSTVGYVAPSTDTDNDADNDGLNDAYDTDCTIGSPCGISNTVGADISTAPINSDTDALGFNLPDYIDIDSDNDGIPDNIEAQTTQGYVPPSGNVGVNGVDAAYENNDTYTSVTGLTPLDFDNTVPNLPDYRDNDSDNDGTPDIEENGGSNSISGTDTDGDGLDDNFEGANTGDIDANDEIDDPLLSILPDADGDKNGAGDLDYRDAINSPDTDGDSIIDSIDIDDDNDGILDTLENVGGINPNADSDGDGIPNYLDVDDNGGGTLGDLNGDGVQDYFDLDGDGVANHLDIDSDNDGIPDNIEAQPTATYFAPSGPVGANGLYNIYGSDDNDLAATSFPIENTDGTDTPDFLDLDSDNDGTPDIDENGNGDTFNATDTDGDGLVDIFDTVDNTTEPWDSNDSINNPLSSILPDTDGDSGSGGDLDYRDDSDDTVLVSLDDATLWLRADMDVTGDATVTSWVDQTTGLDFTGTGGTNSPDNTVAANNLNFNPVVTFNSGNDVLTNTNDLDPRTMYIVYNDVSTASSTTPFTNNDGNGIGFGHTSEDQIYNDPDTPSDVRNGVEYVSGFEDNFLTRDRPDNYELHSRVFANNLPNASHTYYVGRDRTDNTRGIIGSIAEIMLFSVAHTDIQRQQIESYLALKYGFTLNGTEVAGGIIEGNYVTEDLTVIWDNDIVKTYHNDVAGIGKDMAMEFLQKQSKSINSDAVITIGLGAISNTSVNNSNFANTNNITGNKSFLVWGNNGASLTNNSSTPILCSEKKQLDRVWKIVETGTIGTVEVAIIKDNGSGFVFDTVLDLGLTNEIPVIIVADDPSFTTNVRHIPLTIRQIDGSSDHLVANIDFNGTKYFTYAVINAIFWNGDATTKWTGASDGSSFPPTIDDDVLNEDGTKVLIIDGETSETSAILSSSANVECVWIKPNSKLIVNNTKFLEFDGELKLEGEIKLIGNAHLVQSHLGFTNVSGNGKLYRDQKTSVPNIYRYNYWSSPVVPALGDSQFTVEGVMNDGTTPTSENSSINPITFLQWDGDLSDITNTNGTTDNPIKIASHWIYSYTSDGNGGDRNAWIHKKNDGLIAIGDGYTMKSTGRVPQNFTFVGTPNDGTINKTITPGDVYLVGNPYPSAIDADLFITDNNPILDGTLYFWEHLGESTTTASVEGHGTYGYIGGYSIRNQAQGIAANTIVTGTAGLSGGDGSYTSPSQFIPVGQAFFVEALNGGTFSFENSQRVYSDNNTLLKGAAKTKIVALSSFKVGFNYINKNNINIHRQLGVNFKSGNTFNYDNGFDSQIFDIQPTDAYWQFEDGKNLAIAGLGEITKEMQIPIALNIDSDKPVYILVDEKVNMDSYKLYLVDLFNGQIHNLQKPVELNLPKGEYVNRFAIVFNALTLNLKDIELGNDISTYVDNNLKELVIKNKGPKIITKVELFNILGQKVKEWKNLENTNLHKLKVDALSSTIYIVKVQTEQGNLTKKIMID